MATGSRHASLSGLALTTEELARKRLLAAAKLQHQARNTEAQEAERGRLRNGVAIHKNVDGGKTVIAGNVGGRTRRSGGIPATIETRILISRNKRTADQEVERVDCTGTGVER